MVALEPRRRVSSVLGYGQSLVNRVADEETRQRIYTNTSNFATEQPLLASFLLAQLALSALPLLLFTSFAFGTICVAFVAAIGFCCFWIGVALFILIPTLFVTLGLGVLVWLWALGSWIVARFAYGLVYGDKNAGRKSVSIYNGNGSKGVDAHSFGGSKAFGAGKTLGDGVEVKVGDGQ